jgi:hypothetical protein
MLKLTVFEFALHEQPADFSQVLGTQFADFIEEATVELPGVQAIDEGFQFLFGFLRVLLGRLFLLFHTERLETVPLG